MSTFAPPVMARGAHAREKNTLQVFASIYRMDRGIVSRQTLERHGLLKGAAAQIISELSSGRSPVLMAGYENRRIVSYRIVPDSPNTKKLIRALERLENGGQPKEAAKKRHPIQKAAVIEPQRPIALPATSTVPPDEGSTRSPDSLLPFLDSLASRMETLENRVRDLERKSEEVAPEIVPIASSIEGAEKTAIIIVDGGNFENRIIWVDQASGRRYQNGMLTGVTALIPLDNDGPAFPYSDVKKESGAKVFVSDRATMFCTATRPFGKARFDLTALIHDLSQLPSGPFRIARCYYFTTLHPDYLAEQRQWMAEFRRKGISIIAEEHAQSLMRNREDAPIASMTVAAGLLFADVERKAARPLPTELSLVLVSGDGIFGYPIALGKQLLRQCYDIRLTTHVVSWREGLSRRPRLDYVLPEIADSVTYLDDLSSIKVALEK